MRAVSDLPTRPHTRSNGEILAMLMAASATLSAGNGSIFALTPEIQKAHGFTTAELGFITGALFCATVVCLLTLSHLADRGHARRMVVAGLAIGSAALVWIGAASDLWEYVAARALSGLAFSLVLAGSHAIAVRLDPTTVGHSLGRLTAAEVGGFVLGPVLGTALFSLAGLRGPFWTLAALAAVAAVVFTARFPADADVIEERDEALAWWQLSGIDLLSSRNVVAACLFGLALYLPVGVYDALWAKYLSDLGASSTFIGISLTIWGVPLALLSGPGGRLVDRVGARRVTTIALFVMVPVLVLYGSLTSYWAVAIVAIVEALASSVAMPGAQAAMAHACPTDRAAAGQGLAALTGMTTAGLIGSVAPAIYAANGPFRLFSGLALGVIALAVAANLLTTRTVTVAPAS